MSKATETADVVRAKRIELVDSDGKVRVRIGPDDKRRARVPRSARHDPEDWYRVEFLDRSGGRLAMLRCADEGLSRLEVGDESWHLGVHAERGRFPDWWIRGPHLSDRDRVADRSTLLRALPAAQKCLETFAANTTRWKNEIRKHVRQQCEEFGVDVPDWAQPAKREPRRRFVEVPA